MPKLIDDNALRQLFRYEPGTGRIFWASGPKEGQQAGTAHSANYCQVCFGDRLVLAHRLAWFLHYGVWPAGSIDHINGIRHDNRLVNLRDVTVAENSMNRRGEMNASGYPGVTKYRKRWGARLVVSGKRLWLGQHDTPEQAHAAYRQAAILFGYHENHGLPTIFG